MMCSEFAWFRFEHSWSNTLSTSWSTPLRWLIPWLCLLAGGPCPAAEWLVGAARIDLTPPASLKAALGGYSARLSRPAQGVHDRVWAKALTFAEGDKRLVLVTADVLAFPPPVKPALRERLERLGITVDEMILLPSHTHNSIDMLALHPGNRFQVPQLGIYHPQLYEHTLDKLAEVIQASGRALEPARAVSLRQKLTGWNRNRRGGLTVDPDLTLLRIDRLDGRPLAVVAQFTAHPTLLGASEMLFSGDWPGALQRSLEERIGGGVTVLYHNGAQGDLSPAPREEKAPAYEKAEAYGRALAQEAHALWREGEGQTRRPTQFAFRKTTFDLPPIVKPPAPSASPGLFNELLSGTLEQMVKELLPRTSHSVALRVDDWMIVGMPGEFAAELGREVKQRVARATGAKHVVIGGLADEWLSYFLTEAEYVRGGYEPTLSFFGPRGGPTLVEAITAGASRLRPEKPEQK